MITKIKIIGLVVGFVVSITFSAGADYEIPDNLIVNAISDGTAPAYDCSPGATLPFYPLDSSSVTETIPAGDPVINLLPVNCDFSTDQPPYMCEYICTTPSGLGDVCVGMDCINGESFNGDVLRLKENNLRIRFHNTAVGDVLGESWNIEANSSQNGGLSYFDFQVKSVEKDNVMLSDGTAPSYDCSATGLLPTPFQPTGTIPFGEPVQKANEINCKLQESQYMCEISCEEIPYYTVKSVLKLGTADSNPAFNDGVAIGLDSMPEDGLISVGRAGLARRIARIAAGIGGMDALTLEDLKIERLALLAPQIAVANAELDEIEGQIENLETWQPLIDAVNGIDDSAFKNKNMKKALINKINAVLKMLDGVHYQGTLHKLEHDILSITNGCADTGSPDKNDWLTDCQSQGAVYPLIIEAIAHLQNLV